MNLLIILFKLRYSIMQNKTSQTHKEENLFHKFVLSADSLPSEANIFPYFQFMDLSIRKMFHQLKKTGLRKQKVLYAFEEFWIQLNQQEKVNLYIKWAALLHKALQIQKKPNFKLEPESVTIQDQIYLKTAKLFNKWDKRIAKLTPTHLLIISNRHTKQYQLRQLQIRKSKSKQNFSWVLHSISKKGRILHCGVSNQNMFNQWYYSLLCNINNQRIDYFIKSIKMERENPGVLKSKFETETLQMKQNFQMQDQPSLNNKTLTEIMIAKQMKTIDRDDQFSDFEQETFSVQNVKKGEKSKFDKEPHDLEKMNSNISQSKENPNIFKKLFPDHPRLETFTDTPINCPLLHCTSQFRIYQLASDEQFTSNLKFFTILPYPKSLIFQALTSEITGWNDDVQLLTIKTNISSENTVLYYEKNKPQGILYRQRDFLYLRHCFSSKNLKNSNTFIIDKSIDSIHQPPFMTLVRAQKKLIWGLIEKQKDKTKQCILIVQGWIKGGGYMNQVQNREMTVRFMKKIMNLKGFLKQLDFSTHTKGGLLFKQDWLVDFDKQQPIPQQKNRSNEISDMMSQSSSSDKPKSQKPEEKKNKIQDQVHKNQLIQFMKRTNQEHLKDINSPDEQKSEISVHKSQQILSSTQIKYKPPPINQKGNEVIIPKQYLTKVHVLVPKEKPKKPNFFPHFRGHHLWKGQWEVHHNGGLAYVDQQKMREQKKVLTYIIKRIGKNIFSGKGILNISLPVDIFCAQSNVERIAMSFGFIPYYFEKAAIIKEQQIAIKYIVASGVASSLIYLTMQKPFNPILGETYQCWVDQCPIYFEQVSHHPPQAAFLMYGRGYRLSGLVEAKMDLSINSGTGGNEGVFTVQFDNGNIFHYTTAPGCLTGLTYGQRKLNLVGKCYYWSNEGLYLELIYNPAAKTKGFFGGGVKGDGDQKLPDYFEGTLKKYELKDLKSITEKQSNGKSISIMPKGSPSSEALKIYYKICGRWNQYVLCDKEKVFDVNETRYYPISDEKYPLPSHSNYREDIVFRRLKNFVTSQDCKQVLEILQRQDRKLRAKHEKDSRT